MNQIIEEQLSKVRIADLPLYDEYTQHLIIPKKDKATIGTLELFKSYLIEIENYILNPPDGFSLHSNWNKGIGPKCKHLKVEVIQLAGKMIKVKSVGFDCNNNRETEEVWEGWLPSKAIKIIRRL